MWRRLWAICRKEWIQIRRDPRTLAVVWLLPITQLLLYGYAMDFDLKEIRVALVDYDHSEASRRLAGDFARSPQFRVAARPERAAEAERLVVDADVREALVIPAGFERSLRRGEPAQVQVLLDGSDSTFAGISLGYTRGLVESFSAAWARERPYGSVGVWEYGSAGTGSHTPPHPHTPTLSAAGLDVRTRVLYNPELRSTNFIVPGLIAVLLTMLAALLTSNAVVRERERGTFEALIATPVRPLELMVGKLIPYVILAFAQVIVVVVVGWAVFDVVPRGSLVLLAGLSLIFLLAALAIGLLISTVARTQQVALMGAIMATVIPSQLLSGFAFPVRNMPEVLQVVANVIPATHYLVIVRSIFMKGVGMEVLWRQALILSAFAAVLLLACARRFRKTL